MKADANEVEQKMKSDRLPNGQKRFLRLDWLSSQQIKSFWSNLTKAKAKKHISAVVEAIDETALLEDFDEREAEMDAAAAEAEELITECCEVAAMCTEAELADTDSAPQKRRDGQKGRQGQVARQLKGRAIQRRRACSQQKKSKEPEEDEKSPETRTPDAKRFQRGQRSPSSSSDDDPLAGVDSSSIVLTITLSKKAHHVVVSIMWTLCGHRVTSWHPLCDMTVSNV